MPLMRPSLNLRPTFDFLSHLEQNNNKVWFDSHRAQYDQARESFEYFVDNLISELGKSEELGSLRAKDCMFRINRDIRFSKDKSPYKTNMAAEIAPGGRKSSRQGYYLHTAPHGKSFLAGGLHESTPEQLSKFRQAIAQDASTFKKITKNKKFVQYFGSIEGDKVMTAPQGYSRDHPEIELLKLKQVLAWHRLPDKQVLSRDFLDHTVQTCKALKPFLDYLNSILL